MLNGMRQRREMLKAWACHDAHTYACFDATVRQHGIDLASARVLDLGCGANAPMSLILHASGVDVVGVDAYTGYRWGLGFSVARYASYRSEVGTLKTLRKVAGELVFDSVYYKALGAAAGRSLSERNLDLRRMTADCLEFPNDRFDVIHSNATWEHLLDVPAVNAELARLLRPGGIAYIEIHLFPSLSGGHDLPWIVPGRTDLGGIKPWRHLRDRSWSAPVPLNRFRERDFRRLFEQTPDLEIVEWKTEYTEGGEFLTDAIMAELHDFSREELTKRSVIAVLRKRTHH